MPDVDVALNLCRRVALAVGIIAFYNFRAKNLDWSFFLVGQITQASLPTFREGPVGISCSDIHFTSFMIARRPIDLCLTAVKFITLSGINNLIPVLV